MRRRLAVFVALAALFAATRADAEEREGGPNRLLLATGSATLGFSYVVSSYVALESARASEKWLFVPLAGPWVALARREDCGDRCGVDAADRALFVVDGLVQLGGLAQVVVAFAERGLAEERQRPIVVPMHVNGGTGLAAVGTF